MAKTLLSYIDRVLRLAYSFAKANFKLRNEGSYLGLFWYLLGPLAMFTVILFVKKYAFIDAEISYYPIYLLIGILMFNFFTQTISAAFSIIEDNAGFIKSVRVPLESIVVARVFQSMFSHIFEIVIIVISMIYFKIGITALLVYIAVMAIFTVLMLGLSFIAAVLGAYLRDMRNVWVIVSQILFFITPIFYIPVSGSQLDTLNNLNPLYLFMEAGRSMFIFGVLPHPKDFAMLVLLTCVTLIAGLYVFIRSKSKFAELV